MVRYVRFSGFDVLTWAIRFWRKLFASERHNLGSSLDGILANSTHVQLIILKLTIDTASRRRRGPSVQAAFPLGESIQYLRPDPL